MHNSETTGAPDEVPQPFENAAHGQTRRQFVTQITVAGTGLAAAPLLVQSAYGAERAVRPNSRIGGISICGRKIAN